MGCDKYSISQVDWSDARTALEKMHPDAQWFGLGKRLAKWDPWSDHALRENEDMVLIQSRVTQSYAWINVTATSVYKDVDDLEKQMGANVINPSGLRMAKPPRDIEF
jgi:hypothetical protein